MTTETRRPAQRKLTRKGQETRRRIVAAAATLMYERGVTEATLEDVRAAAGVSGSQIYHYFADKQELLLAVIEFQTEAVLDMQKPLFAGLDTMKGLRQWRDALVEYQLRLQCRGGCPIGSLGSEIAETNPEARLAAASGFLRWESAIREGLQKMYDRGELDTDPDDRPRTPRRAPGRPAAHPTSAPSQAAGGGVGRDARPRRSLHEARVTGDRRRGP